MITIVKYTYSKSKYFIDQTLTGVISLVGIIIIPIVYFLYDFSTVLPIIFFITCVYTFWNSFVAKVNSEIVGISETKVSFEAYGKKDVYSLDKIEKMNIREFPSSGKMYIRIYNNNKKNRYWIHTKRFEEGLQLFHKLRDVEYTKHPETIKSKARTVNTRYLALKNEKENK